MADVQLGLACRTIETWGRALTVGNAPARRRRPGQQQPQGCPSTRQMRRSCIHTDQQIAAVRQAQVIEVGRRRQPLLTGGVRLDHGVQPQIAGDRSHLEADAIAQALQSLLTERFWPIPPTMGSGCIDRPTKPDPPEAAGAVVYRPTKA